MQPRPITDAELIFCVIQTSFYKLPPQGATSANAAPPTRTVPEESEADKSAPVLRGLLIMLPTSLILWAVLVFLYLSWSAR